MKSNSVQGFIFFSIAIIICVILYFATKKSYFKAYKATKLILPIGVFIFVVLLLFFSKESLNAAIRGLDLWFNVVFPSLFPFFVGSELLYKTGFVRAAGVLFEPVMRPLFNVPGCGSFAFAVGIASGYPVGAKVTSDMRDENLLTKTEAERLITFTNNSGPLFMAGAVASGMFENPSLGILFMISHYLACISVGILFRFYKRNEKSCGYEKCWVSPNKRAGIFRRSCHAFLSGVRQQPSIGTLLGDSVRNSINTLLAVGGFIMIFSVIIHLLLNIGAIKFLSELLAVFLCPIGIDKAILPAIVSGFFEITTGAKVASLIDYVPFEEQLAAASFIIGWAGLSVHSQVISIVAKSDLSVKPYFIGKFLQGVFSYIFTLILAKKAGFLDILSRPAFANLVPKTTNSWQGWLQSSVYSLCIMVVSVLVLGLIVSFTANLLKYKAKRH